MSKTAAMTGQAGINIFEVNFLTQAMMHSPAEDNRYNRSGQRYQVPVRHGGYPQTGPPIPGHPKDACRKKESLQGRAELLR
jgi:hypothetical protein